jgi:hypothetical protein
LYFLASLRVDEADFLPVTELAKLAGFSSINPSGLLIQLGN